MDRKLDAWISAYVMCNLEDTLREDVPKEYQTPRYTSDLNEAVKVLKKHNQELSLWFYAEDNSWTVNDVSGLFEVSLKDAEPAMVLCLAAYKLKTGEDWKGE